MRLQRLFQRLDDALNPIVVKELRQAVHGRFLAGILIFFLALQLTTLGVFLLARGISAIDLVGGTSYGEEVFFVLVGILFFAAVFCVPIYAAARMVAERRGNGNMALYFISTLSPRSIVAGKLASNLLLVLLLFAACLPYLSFTYFLRGIDLPTVFIALGIGFLASAAGIQLAVLLASLPATRVLRILIALAGLGWLMTLFTGSLTFAAALPQIGIASRLGSWELWGPVSVTLVSGVLLFGLAFSLTVALVTHAAANRARPVRIYATVAWLVSAAGAVYAGVAHGQEEILAAWAYLAMLLLAGSLLPAVCARDRMSVRVAGEVPRSQPGRLASFFLFSGSANGVAWSAAMIAATWAVAEVVGDLDELPAQLLGLCAYVFAYALLGMLAQRHLLGRWLRRRQTWVAVLTLIAAGSLVPPIAGFLLAPDAIGRSLDFGSWLILNPFSPFRRQIEDYAIRFGLFFATVTATFSARWFLDQARAFRPPPAAAPAAAAAVPLIADHQAEGS